MSAPDTGREPFRPRPRVTALTEPFWTCGRDGVLRIQRCNTCGYFVHPPSPICPQCHGRALAFTPVSGGATVVACTRNHQPWYPGWTVPYVVAIVELAEQPGLRLTTNVVECDPGAVHIGMPVQVRFLPLDDTGPGTEQARIWLPLFAPMGMTTP